MASPIIPPWISIDPIAPARIRLQANQQRNAAAASERAAQAQAEELQFRRDNAANQAAQEEAQLASRERASLRRDQVLKQTNDRELAQAAQQMQLRREAQAQKADQFQQTLRMKQRAAEAEAKVAARQMQGAKAFQEGLQKGIPQQELLAKYGADIFAKNPSGMVGAVQRGMPNSFPDPRMINVKDEQNNPTGVFAIPSRGGVHVMRPEGLGAREQAMLDRTRLNYLVGQIREGDESEAEKAEMKREVKALNEKMKNPASYQSHRLPGPLPPRVPAVPSPPSAQSIPPSGGGSSTPPDEGGASVESDEEAGANIVRVKSPDGKMGVIPEDQLDDALEAGYEEIDTEEEGQA